MTRIFCDGSGWNGKQSKFGVLSTLDNITICFNQNITSNVMEYSAILLAATIADEGDELATDSQLAVNQIKGVWKTKDAKLKPLRDAAAILIAGKRIKLMWVPRRENRADKII
jgi:ribonuclease HI